jgi:hypothetical protein
MFTGMGRHWGRGFGSNHWGMGFALRTSRLAAKANRAKARTHKVENLRHSDYKTEVSLTAGEIHRLLRGRGRIGLDALRDESKHKGIAFMAALGWLMREDKVEVISESHGVTVRLKD